MMRRQPPFVWRSGLLCSAVFSASLLQSSLRGASTGMGCFTHHRIPADARSERPLMQVEHGLWGKHPMELALLSNHHHPAEQTDESYRPFGALRRAERAGIELKRFALRAKRGRRLSRSVDPKLDLANVQPCHAIGPGGIHPKCMVRGQLFA